LNLSYQQKNTVVHRLHPVGLLIWVLGIIMGSIVIQDPLVLLVIFFSMVPFVIIGKITRAWWSFMYVALWLSLFIIGINVLINPHGNTVLFQVTGVPVFSTIQLTMESLVFALTMSLRLLCMISAFALLSLLINPDVLLHVFLKLRFPKKSVLTTSIALRFMPVLLQDVQALQDSIQTRGFSLHPKGMIQKVKQRSMLLMPLLSTALDRSIQTAEAMEARGFGSSQKMQLFTRIPTTLVDGICIICSLVLIGFMMWLWVAPVASFSFYPQLSLWSWTPLYGLVLCIVCVVVLLPLMISPLKKVIDIDPFF